MDAPSPCVNNVAGEGFSKYKGDAWKKFLKERGSQLSDGGKDKRKQSWLICAKKRQKWSKRSLSMKIQLRLQQTARREITDRGW